jgi:hypothetical protein
MMMMSCRECAVALQALQATPSVENLKRIADLSRKDDSHDNHIRGIGGLEAVTEALRRHMDNAAVAEQGCGAICNLAASNNENQAHFSNE